MNKRNILLCIIIITLFFIGFMFFYYSGDKYEKLIVDENEWNEIVNKRNITESIIISSFKINDYEAFFDNSQCTYYYSIIEGKKNAFNPKIKLKTNKKNAKIAVDKSINEKLIKDNDVIHILVYTDTEFCIYNLRCTTLPILNINCASFDDITKEDSYKMDLFLFDNRKNATSRIITSEGKIHSRGGISKVFPKLGYKINLTTKSLGNNTRNNDLSLLGMRKDDDWILYAGYNDQEKIRNVFTTNLWNESCAKNNMFGINNGNEFKFVELFINNSYWGLYAIGYPIDEKQMDLDSENEYLFKKFQYDTVEEDILINGNFDSGHYKLLNKTSNEKDAWDSLKDYYVKILTSDNIEELYSISDINNVIDYYLYQEFIQGNDNAVGKHLKNVFITIKKFNNKNVVLYTPWDNDLSFGNGYEEGAKNFGNPYNIEVNKTIDFTMNAIGALRDKNDSNINGLIEKRYKELRKTYWSEEHIEKLISDYSKIIYDSGAFKRDEIRWPAGTYNYGNTELTEFKNYIFKRLEYLDDFINKTSK